MPWLRLDERDGARVDRREGAAQQAPVGAAVSAAAVPPAAGLCVAADVPTNGSKIWSGAGPYVGPVVNWEKLVCESKNFAPVMSVGGGEEEFFSRARGHDRDLPLVVACVV